MFVTGTGLRGKCGRASRAMHSRCTGSGRPSPPAALDDLYHYLLTAYWPVLLLMIAGLFVAANLIFALAYFLDGGLEGARPGSFADAFFFSVQTMATIGLRKAAYKRQFCGFLRRMRNIEDWLEERGGFEPPRPFQNATDQVSQHSAAPRLPSSGTGFLCGPDVRRRIRKASRGTG